MTYVVFLYFESACGEPVVVVVMFVTVVYNWCVRGVLVLVMKFLYHTSGVTITVFVAGGGGGGINFYHGVPLVCGGGGWVMQVMTYDSQRGGVSVVTEKGPQTTTNLLVRAASNLDSGTYKCNPSNAPRASVNVHVING